MEPSATLLCPRLEARWAVVTGGSKGIGAAIARALHAAGANVVLVARGVEDLELVAADLRSRSSSDQQVLTHVSDVADPRSIGELFAWLDASLPRLDIFVANAGTGATTPFLDLSVQQWDDIIALNLTGVMLCCQGAARAMLRNPEADRSILVISSVRGLRAANGRLAYSVSKAAVNQLVRMAAAELAPHRIRVNALSPGITETPLTALHPVQFLEAVGNVPLGRAGNVEELAAAALFLCSEASRFTTGANLVVDGGEVLG
jgi:3-oxoacyl-[acyl-carrier protein] reductase